MQKAKSLDHEVFVALRAGMSRSGVKWLVLLVVLLTAGPLPTAVAEPFSVVDPALVGVWEQRVPNPFGIARWEMDIRADGTYNFRTEGPGAAPGHAGTFGAADGRWELEAPAIHWADGGAYELPTPNTFVMHGKLGTGVWTKIPGTAKNLAQNTQPSKTITPEESTPGAAGAVAEVEPCSLLTLAEVSVVLNAPATMDRPHRVRRNNVTVGGDCVYRSGRERTTLVTLQVDAYPAGHQRTAFARGRQRPHVVDVSGVGDAAYATDPPGGPKNLTFLQGEVLVTVIVTDPLGVAEARQLATLAAARLPAPTAESPAPSTSSQPSASTQPGTCRQQPGSPAPPAAFDPPGQPVGNLDPVLVGSWYLTQPSGRARANLTVRPDGVFLMELLASGRTQQGRIEGRDGVLRLRTEDGRVQEIRYQVIAADQMEWIDQNGSVTVVRAVGMV